MELINVNKAYPDDFLWGASSSSFQFEGAMDEDGRGPSVIDHFQLSKEVTDFSIASDHYHHMEEDIRLAHEAGLKSYRFSISWSRIFKSGKHEVNPKGVAFYQRLLDELHRYSIEPVVTIYHFDYPQGLADAYGGWTSRESIDDFVAYCRFLFETFGSQIKYWLTINEQDHVIRIPMRMGLTGKEENYDKLRYQANHNMCVASAKVFKLCRELLPGAHIGPALSYAPIYPKSSKPEDILAAADTETLTMSYMNELHCKGVYPIRLWKYLCDRGIEPEIEAGDMELMKQNPPTFLGLNYYSTRSVSENPVTKENPIGRVEGDLIPIAEAGIYRACVNEHLPRTSFGWEIDAIGLRLALENLYERYNLPIMITENGLSHPDVLEHETVEDDYRIEYIREHIKQMNLAINTGVEVLGYHLWSFIDLVSGREGFRKRYGLVYVNRDDFDLKDLKRYKKKSFYWYKKVIQSKGTSL